MDPLTQYTQLAKYVMLVQQNVMTKPELLKHFENDTGGLCPRHPERHENHVMKVPLLTEDEEQKFATVCIGCILLYSQNLAQSKTPNADLLQVSVVRRTYAIDAIKAYLRSINDQIEINPDDVEDQISEFGMMSSDQLNVTLYTMYERLINSATLTKGQALALPLLQMLVARTSATLKLSYH